MRLNTSFSYREESGIFRWCTPRLCSVLSASTSIRPSTCKTHSAHQQEPVLGADSALTTITSSPCESSMHAITFPAGDHSDEIVAFLPAQPSSLSLLFLKNLFSLDLIFSFAIKLPFHRLPFRPFCTLRHPFARSQFCRQGWACLEWL